MAYFNGFCKDEERNKEKEHCIHKASYDFRSDVTKEGRREEPIIMIPGWWNM